MKTKHLPILALLFIALVIALVIANFSHPVAAAQNMKAGSALLQTTPTPATDESVIGSTDGIMLMGIVITAIILIPLLFRNKKGSKENIP
ncbi:MAG: hypothetical protein HZB50_04855 [Chloroflexi bacterium]|nr:hypothetical protein [Chloroflexota bacterium]